MSKEEKDLLSGIFALAIKQISNDPNPESMTNTIAAVINFKSKVLQALEEKKEDKKDGKDNK